MRVDVLFATFGLGFVARALGLGASEPDSVFVGVLTLVGLRAGLAHLVEVDRLGHFGPIMFSGRTTRSNVASSTNPSAMASSLSVVPFLCAVFATVVALSYPIVGASAVTSIRLSRMS